MRVLLTGASGFIGSHLLDLLCERGHEVVAFSRRPLSDLPQNARNVQADLTDTDAVVAALRGCDAVAHLAAVSSPVTAAADPLGCFLANTAATGALAHLAADQHVPRFVFTSTSLVYGQPAALPITEHTPPDPLGPYPASKFAAEALVAHLHPASLILRVFNVYGPRQRGTLVPSLIERISSGAPVTLQGDGGQVRSFLYVSDAVAAITLALESLTTGILNLSGTRSTILQVHDTIAAALGSASTPSFSEPRPGDPREVWAAHDAITAELGWEPLTPLAEGIARTVASS